ncbi:formylglycine-generating enzyme family protein [Streptomyces sp. NPDC012756]|uniref:formylglycine-generating enzyme family protein n=1 Tax=Streptomyces sp. NPDC012756 TaxID=3364847 RepID=UPI0036C76AB5
MRQGPFPYARTGADGWWAIAPVRSYPANGFGLYEVSGSVWDRCSDRFAADYCARSPHQDPQGPKEGARRVVRGGPGKRSEDVLAGHGSQSAERPSHQAGSRKSCPLSGKTLQAIPAGASVHLMQHTTTLAMMRMMPPPPEALR